MLLSQALGYAILFAEIYSAFIREALQLIKSWRFWVVAVDSVNLKLSGIRNILANELQHNGVV